jgi:hypothetical protein
MTASSFAKHKKKERKTNNGYRETTTTRRSGYDKEIIYKARPTLSLTAMTLKESNLTLTSLYLRHSNHNRTEINTDSNSPPRIYLQANFKDNDKYQSPKMRHNNMSSTKTTLIFPQTMTTTMARNVQQEYLTKIGRFIRGTLHPMTNNGTAWTMNGQLEKKEKKEKK